MSAPHQAVEALAWLRGALDLAERGQLEAAADLFAHVSDLAAIAAASCSAQRVSVEFPPAWKKAA